MKKIRSTLRINLTPDGERYAHIIHDKYGKCSIHRRDGLCSLQIELRECLLLQVCRLYLRNRRQSRGTDDGERTFTSLCTIWAFAKIVFVGNLSCWETIEDHVDLLSKLGRMMEHSDFKYRAEQYYRKYADDSPGYWYWRQLVSL